MKVKINYFILILASLALANAQLVQQSSDRVDSPGQSNSGTGWSWFESKVLDGVGRAKQFGKWLVTSTNRNYNDHSDKVDSKIGKAEMDMTKGLKMVDTSVVDYKTPRSQLNFLETFFRAGRGAFSGGNFIRLAYETLGGLGSCVATRDWTDDDLGTMTLNASTWCDIRCGRMLPGVTCCHPQKPDAIDVKLILFRPGHEERVLNWRDPSEVRHLNSNSGRIVFVTHGWMEKISISQWMTDVIDGFHANGDTAVVVVDWRGGNGVQYWQAIANLRTLGAVVGHAIGIWGIADQTLFVGFSLGGQMIGQASKYLTKKFGQKIAECHGLDPAGPFFDACSPEVTLNKDDCQLTQIIHTSAGDIPTVEAAVVRFGTWKKSGHCDYWVNCGYNQDPCLDIAFPDLLKGLVRLGAASDGELGNWLLSHAFCSHWRAPDVYVAALQRNVTCPAYECPSCGHTHFCTPKSVQANQPSNRLPPFSRCGPDEDVNYYVASDSFAPYCPS